MTWDDLNAAKSAAATLRASEFSFSYLWPPHERDQYYLARRMRGRHDPDGYFRPLVSTADTSAAARRALNPFTEGV